MEKVKVYYSDVSVLENVFFQAAYDMVSEERREKADRIRIENDKKLCLGVEILLKYALEKEKIFDRDIIYGYGENKKPFLSEHGNIRFNLSHSGKFVMCVISENEVGCDIERERELSIKLAKRFFTEKEYMHLLSIENDNDKKRLFSRYWTLKESFMKVTGDGMRLPLNQFEICMDTRKISVTHDKNTDDKYKFREFFVEEGYSISVCSYENQISDEIIKVDMLAYLKNFYKNNTIKL